MGILSCNLVNVKNGVFPFFGLNFNLVCFFLLE
jgi:hypothetical protein